MERHLAGLACAGENAVDCRTCVQQTDPFTLLSRGTCECQVGATRCSLCTAGEYFRLEGKCEKCPEQPAIIIAAFCVGVLLACFGCYVLDKHDFNLALVSIGVDFFQVLGILASTDIKWPSYILSLFRIFSLFNLNIDIAGPECLVPNLSFAFKFYGTILFPIFVAVAIAAASLLLWLLSAVCPGCAGVRKNNIKDRLSSMVGVFLLAQYFAYLAVTRRALDVFNCNPTTPSDGHLYASFTSVSCPGGVCRCWVTGQLHMSLVPAAALTSILFTLGYPLSVFCLVRKNKRKIKLDQILRALGTGDDVSSNPEAYHIRRRYHKLYYHFKPGKIYWITLILARKAAVAFAGLMFRSNPGFQLCNILLVLFIAYVWQVKNQPYMSTSERANVVAEHRAKVASGNKEHVRINHWVAQAQKLQTRARSFSIQRRKMTGLDDSASEEKRRRVKMSKSVRHDAKEYIWDFNVMEQVLTSCSILVCLAGVMFESDRFSSDDSVFAWQSDLLSILTLAILIFSVVYYVIVFASEVLGCTPRWLQRCFAKKHRRGHAWLHKSEVARQEEEIEMAPMQQNLVILQQRNQLSDEVSKTRAALEQANEANAELFKQMRDGKRQYFHNPLARSAKKQKERRQSVATRKEFGPMMVERPRVNDSETLNPMMERTE
jgi:hypothetical protein